MLSIISNSSQYCTITDVANFNSTRSVFHTMMQQTLNYHLTHEILLNVSSWSWLQHILWCFKCYITIHYICMAVNYCLHSQEVVLKLLLILWEYCSQPFLYSTFVDYCFSLFISLILVIFAILSLSIHWSSDGAVTFRVPCIAPILSDQNNAA